MAQTPVPIAFRSNPARYSFAGNTRLINAYAEKVGDDGKAPLAVYCDPGLVEACEVTDTPGRGTIYLDDLGCAYAVHASGVYKVTLVSLSPFVLAATRIGTVPGNDQVQLSRNQASPVQISIHCELGEYYIEADIVKAVSDIDVTDEVVVSQTNSKGRTIYLAESGKFLWSAISNCNAVDGLDFATAEQVADRGVRVKESGPDVIFFSHSSIEPWRPNDDADLPYELIGGAVQQRGMIAPNGVVESDNTLMFPCEDNIFARLNGYAIQKISTHAQDRLLEHDSDREGVQGFSYGFEGHAFAGWSGTDWSTVYDSSTQVWHDKVSYSLDRWRAINPFRAWGKTIFQDRLSGKLLYLDSETFDEDGSPLVWGMDTPFIHAFPNGGIVDALYIDVAVGVGSLDEDEESFDPVLMLSWSTDGGKTFKGSRQLKLGKRGHYNTRLRTNRLGRFGDKGIQFRIRVSDPVIRGITQMSADIRPLKR